MAYNIKSNPTNGPFPSLLSVEEHSNVVIEYDQDFTYDNSEISGFYVCCISYFECDDKEAWHVIGVSQVNRDSTTKSIEINLKQICRHVKPTGLAYLWEDTPTKRLIGLPIYANDSYGLPAAPWKYELTQLVTN